MNETVRVRVDAEIKEKADKIVKSMGLTLSTAIRMYLIQIVKNNKL